MKISKTPKELETYIQKQLFGFLNKDFKDYLLRTEREMVEKHVYSYEASAYAMSRRRQSNGGLSDMSNVILIPYLNKGAVLYVNNTSPQDLKYATHELSLAEAVEVGHPDWNMGPERGPGPRPFIAETIQEMNSSQKTYSVFKNYFNRLGINTFKK